MNRSTWRRIIVAYKQYHVLTSKYQRFINVYNWQTNDMLASRPASYFHFRKFYQGSIYYHSLSCQLKRRIKLP